MRRSRVQAASTERGLQNADGKSDMNRWKLSPGNADIVGSQRRTLFASNANTACTVTKQRAHISNEHCQHSN